mgnify:CR=1 FL=1
MKTDIEIAQEAKMLHIREVAEKLGIAAVSYTHLTLPTNSLV